MKDQIKSYLQRLNHGEALENVQADFVRECKDVDPAEIMHAEQELLREGTSIEELQRLCDVHSALFHGSTTDAQKLHAKDIQDQRLSAAAALIQISGHPLQTFTLENAALEKLAIWRSSSSSSLVIPLFSNACLARAISFSSAAFSSVKVCRGPLCPEGRLTLSTFEGAIWDQRPLRSHVDSG